MVLGVTNGEPYGLAVVTVDIGVVAAVVVAPLCAQYFPFEFSSFFCYSTDVNFGILAEGARDFPGYKWHLSQKNPTVLKTVKIILSCNCSFSTTH